MDSIRGVHKGGKQQVSCPQCAFQRGATPLGVCTLLDTNLALPLLKNIGSPCKDKNMLVKYIN